MWMSFNFQATEYRLWFFKIISVAHLSLLAVSPNFALYVFYTKIKQKINVYLPIVIIIKDTNTNTKTTSRVDVTSQLYVPFLGYRNEPYLIATPSPALTVAWPEKCSGFRALSNPKRKMYINRLTRWGFFIDRSNLDYYTKMKIDYLFRLNYWDAISIENCFIPKLWCIVKIAYFLQKLIWVKTEVYCHRLIG